MAIKKEILSAYPMKSKEESEELEKRINESQFEVIRRRNEANNLRVYHNRLKYGVAFEKNPFIINEDNGEIILRIDKTIKKEKIGNTDMVLMNYKTGELEPSTNILYRNHDVDSNKFVKLYVGYMQLLFDLTKPAQKLIQFIITELKPNQDEVYIYVPDAKIFCQWKTRNQYYTAIKELTDKEIIAQSIKTGWYFINPSVLFNGDRFTVIDRYNRTKEQLELF